MPNNFSGRVVWVIGASLLVGLIGGSLAGYFAGRAGGREAARQEMMEAMKPFGGGELGREIDEAKKWLGEDEKSKRRK